MRTAAALLAISVLIAPSAPHAKHVAMVLDVSGSMRGDLQHSWKAWREVSGAPTDDAMLAVWTFADKSTRYRVKHDPKSGRLDDWVYLPDAEALGKANSWVESHKANGDTILGPALDAALRAKRDPLTVVLVTDGQFHCESTAKLLDRIRISQAWREARKMSRAQLAVVAVGDYDRKTLETLARAGGGGLFTVR